MAVLQIPLANLIQILRNVTGRVDKNDPAFTDEIMIDYLNMFLQTEHPQEIRIFQDRTWWQFSIDETTLDPMPVDLDALGYSTIGPLAYVDGFKVFWYEDPGQFYYRWPETQPYQPSRPTDVLYYDNSLTFRNPPDKQYDVKISIFKIENSFVGGTLTNDGSILENVPSAYLTRYLAYGTALDILADFNEMDSYDQVMQVYRRYRGQVLARTWNQYNSERTAPDF